MQEKKFGTAPVFFTAISTILGAILFLRFGFAVGTLGFWGVIPIIILGHLVTIPTALAISEIATNKRVEGGGEYFIISRSFGINIGATIGIALYLSQAISVAFYVIAFTESFEFLFQYFLNSHNFYLPRQVISIPVMIILGGLILKQGANLGVKALYIIVAVLAVSLVSFFIGSPTNGGIAELSFAGLEPQNMDQFFVVFAIIFPAFTGMTAGVGLSGDLKEPGKSIPLGTTTATIAGMILYFFIAYKLAVSATPEDLVNNQFIMGDIAFWGVVFIPIGLAASTISSALGSLMVAPRTLQALAVDKAFPITKINSWLGLNRPKDNEPENALVITCLIALVFVAIGDVNAVAMIISMFFMITYGSLCLISFLHQFGSSPSYRPTFKSKWFISLLGFITSFWVMFKINTAYTILAFVLMTLLYIYIDSYNKNRKGISSIFVNFLFQFNRTIQIYIQKKRVIHTDEEWRPSAICISKNSFKRDNAFRLLNWISYKYGFGTYLHRIEGYFSKNTNEQAEQELTKLLKNVDTDNYVYIDTIISPSTTTAIAQSIQIPGIAGMENNMFIFEYDKDESSLEEIDEIIQDFNLVSSGKFDVCILASSRKPLIFKNGIHIWIKTADEDNANLMILLSFIILGHPEWKRGDIKIFDVCKESEVQEVQRQMDELLLSGRLPITNHNIEIITHKEDTSVKTIINEYSVNAGLTIIGFREKSLKHLGKKMFEGYEELGSMLFINSHSKKVIE
ncbi:MAG: amino acid permease [Calditrichaeota bacterium]|nr:MAG: amino acid permease [Calditrichota bacterium]